MFSLAGYSLNTTLKWASVVEFSKFSSLGWKENVLYALKCVLLGEYINIP